MEQQPLVVIPLQEGMTLTETRRPGRRAPTAKPGENRRR
jgi:hypothetical protein